MNRAVLRIDGEVAEPREFSYADLCAIDPAGQVADVSRYDASRRGDAVTLAALLQYVQARPSAKYLGLHSSSDDFHASLPLAPLLERGMLIYRVEGQPLDRQAGGPFRFFIPDHAACHTAEIDECANVKFVDHIELTTEKGFDNRPDDDQQHEELHRQADPH